MATQDHGLKRELKLQDLVMMQLLPVVALNFPLVEVASPAVFALKVTLAIYATNGLGAFFYWRGAKRITRIAVTSEA